MTIKFLECKAVAEDEHMFCEPCKQSWPANDPDPKPCQLANADEKIWCGYIACMIGEYLGEPLGSDKEKAIAKIIERRLWALGRKSSYWMPIETAPTDGTCILVAPGLYNGQSCSMAAYNNDQYSKSPRPYWARSDDFCRVTVSRENPPTHWMPLPPHPKFEA